MSVTFNPFTGNLDFNDTTKAAGSDTQVQFNDGGKLGGDSGLVFNKTTNKLTAGGDVELNDGGSFTTTLQTVTPTANRTISFPDATGTVGLVAGSTSQFVYNNAGAYAGVSTMTFDGTSVTLAGRLINSYTSLASNPAKVFTGTWFTGGTATTTKPHFLIEPSGATSTAWSTSGTGLGVNAASGFAGNLLDLQVNGTRSLAVETTGRTLIGATTARANFDNSTGSAQFQIEGTNSTTRRAAIISSEASASGGSLILAHQRSGTIGGNTALLAEDLLGNFQFQGSDGTEFVVGAFIAAAVDGTPGANDVPTRLLLGTCPDGTAVPVERLRITNDGVIAYSQPAPAAVNATATLTVANLKTGIVTSTSAAATDMTLPTGTDTQGGFSGTYDNMAFEWSVINTGPSLVTVIANTAHTLAGSGAVATGTSARFASRRTAANTFVTYRLS